MKSTQPSSTTSNSSPSRGLDGLEPELGEFELSAQNRHWASISTRCEIWAVSEYSQVGFDVAFVSTKSMRTVSSSPYQSRVRDLCVRCHRGQSSLCDFARSGNLDTWSLVAERLSVKSYRKQCQCVSSMHHLFQCRVNADPIHQAVNLVRGGIRLPAA